MAIVALSILNSCSNKFIQNSYFVDYWTAGLDGKVFLTESNSVSFEYEPIGSILIEEIQGQDKVAVFTSEKSIYKKTDPIYNDNSNSASKTTLRMPSYSSALQCASKEALRMGGDGIINIKATSTLVDKRNAIYVSGMIIKRKI